MNYVHTSDTGLITVADGQYLYLEDAQLTRMSAGTSTDTDSGSPGPAAHRYSSAYSEEYSASDSGSSIIQAGSRAVTPLPSTGTSAPATVYTAGIHAVGTDIPAGEYVILRADPRSDDPYASHVRSGESGYIISQDAAAFHTFMRDRKILLDTGGSAYDDEFEAVLTEYSNVLDQLLIDLRIPFCNSIVKVEAGQYLALVNATASPINEVPYIEHTAETLYKVGYHIPAGTYQLRIADTSPNPYDYGYGSYAAQAFIYKRAISYDLSYQKDYQYEHLSDTTAITVKDGEYLQLQNCYLDGIINNGTNSGPGVGMAASSME